MIKRIFSIATAAAIAASCLCAAAEDELSEKTVVYIDSIESFLAINETIDLDYIYRLTVDLDFEGKEITPLGVSEGGTSYFMGELDGNGHKISNFMINNSSWEETGLFAGMYFASVHDLELTDAQISVELVGAEPESENAVVTEVSTGTLAGLVIESEIYNCRISDISLTTQLTNAGFKSNHIGGVIGYGNGDISNVMVEGISINSKHMVENEAETDKGMQDSVGGIAGISYNKITGCSVTSSALMAETKNAVAYVGGIAGNQKSNLIKSCESRACTITADTGDEAYAGGIAGHSTGMIENCVSGSAITEDCGSFNGFAGGIAGEIGLESKVENAIDELYECHIKDCVFDGSEGSVTVRSKTSEKSVYCGGIAGHMFGPGTISGCRAYIYENSFNSNFVRPSTSVGVYYGGILGRASGGEVSLCYTEGVMKCESDSYTGGIVGSAGVSSCYYKEAEEIPLTSIIRDCESKVDIYVYSELSHFTGGIVGYINSSDGACGAGQPLLENCSSLGDIYFAKSTASTLVGGLAGYVVNAHVYNCVSSSDIEMLSGGDVGGEPVKSSIFLGGFTGRIKEHKSKTVLTEVENCICSGRLSYGKDDSGLISAGSFTESLQGNKITEDADKNPIAEIYPKVSGCYFISDEELKEQAGAMQLSTSEAALRGSYSGWDFDSVWYMTSDGPRLMQQRPGVFGHNAELKNGKEARLTGLKISRPNEISNIIIDVTNLLTGKVESVPIRIDAEEGARYADIEIDVEIGAMCEYSIRTAGKSGIAASEPEINDTQLSMKLSNTSDTSQQLRMIIAEYDQAGGLIGLSTSDDIEVRGGEDAFIEAELPGKGGARCSLMLWSSIDGGRVMMNNLDISE